MRWKWFCIAVIPIALASLVAAASRPRRPYDGDRRLLRAVDLKPSVGPPVTVWVSRLADATGVPLACDSRLRLRPAALACQKDVRAVDVLEALEEASGGKWVRYERGYALVEIPETLPWCLKPAAEAQDAIGENGRALVNSLTPEQRRRIQEGERLYPSDLSEPQRRALGHVVRCAVAVDPGWQPEALVGNGVWLRASSQGSTVELMLPSFDLDRSISLFEF